MDEIIERIQIVSYHLANNTISDYFSQRREDIEKCKNIDDLERLVRKSKVDCLEEVIDKGIVKDMKSYCEYLAVDYDKLPPTVKKLEQMNRKKNE